MKAVDWKRLIFGPCEYFLAFVFGQQEAGTLQALFAVVQKLLITTCNTDSDRVGRANKAAMMKLKVEVVLTLAKIERDLPCTLLAYIVHNLIHVPEHILRWNLVRNYWAFFSERYHSSFFSERYHSR